MSSEPTQSDAAFMRADIGAIDALLSRLHPSRVAERIGLESRRAELAATLAATPLRLVVAVPGDAPSVITLTDTTTRRDPEPPTDDGAIVFVGTVDGRAPSRKGILGH